MRGVDYNQSAEVAYPRPDDADKDIADQSSFLDLTRPGGSAPGRDRSGGAAGEAFASRQNDHDGGGPPRELPRRLVTPSGAEGEILLFPERAELSGVIMT